MTKNQMITKIADDLKMLQTDVKEVIQHTFDEIINILKTDGRLELRNFGVFAVRKRRARRARNPRTGEEVMLEERKIVVFHAGKAMQERVQGKIKTRKIHETEA